MVISLFVKEKIPPISSEKLPTGVVITTYKNLGMSIPLIYSLLKQEYTHFHVYVVVDRPEQKIPPISDERVSFLIPPQSLDSKLKSIDFALDRLDPFFQSIIVLDPDNLVPSFFISRVNDYLTQGFAVVQGRRIAKNLDTTYACLDALGEIYKTYLERYVPYKLGGSANITGSGYGIKANLLKSFVKDTLQKQQKSEERIILAEDKLLQNYLLNNEFRIAFAEKAYVYDEKVATGDQVTRQRSRWILAYIQNIGPSLHLLTKGILNLKVGKILFALLALYPPLFLTLGVSLLLGFVDTFVSIWGMISMLIGMAIFSGTILWSLSLSHAPIQVWHAVWSAPLFMGRQIVSLFRIRRARRNFLPTTHNHKTSIEEIESEQSNLFISKTDT